jgi:choline transport protein
MVAAPKNRAPLAFICGWVSVLAWDMATSSAFSFCAQIILNIASFLNPEYEWTQWQVYLLYVLLTMIAVVTVNFMPRQLPLMEQVFFWMSISGFIATAVAMLARSPHRQSASTVFVDWTNETGWSDGTAFLLSAGACMYMYVALDA